MTSPYFTAARWPAPLATTGLWALAAASAVFWGLRLGSPSNAIAAAATMARPAATSDSGAVARLFGAVPLSTVAPTAPEAASRFALAGVVADPSKQGAALIAVDGKPPRPFRVGAQVDNGYVLQSVSLRAATLGSSVDAPPAFTLQLPVPSPISVSAAKPGTTPPPAIAPLRAAAPVVMPPPVRAPREK